MSKNTEEKKEKLKQKLEYLGLNLERVPKVLKEFSPFSFKPTKSYDDTSYKIYKYVLVSDIQILLAPTDRLTDLNQKYKLSSPVSNYLDSKSEENALKFDTFLNMLNDMDIQKIEEIEKEQQKLKEMLPYQIKYPNNYIWQIYYSDISNQYFMLVPTNEINNSAFFYLLKKQIESCKYRKKEYIFVPITHQDYSGSYLLQSQITDLENYLWYFTKKWPNIYEVYDAKNNMILKIVGKTKVYEEVESEYVITIQTKSQAIEWYKLIKALFILSTALTNDYKFQTAISKNGELGFFFEEDTKIEYINLPIFIKEQAEKKKILVELENRKIEEQQEKLQNLKQITKIQTEEFLNKQRQIATFLNCKKSFFGKIKYYFTNRNKHLGSLENNRAKLEKTNEKEKNVEEQSIEENKQVYTIEDLIEICTKLDGRTKVVKNLEMDTKALELKKVNLERKIKNANIYLNEIELHKKSIFEFWKFTSKDELPSLNEGEEKEDLRNDEIGKSFIYSEDIEALGKQMDELQRRKLSKNETDSIFAIKQALKSCQILMKTESQELSEEQIKNLQNELDKLKKEYEQDKEVIEVKDFDIFGSIIEDKTKVKLLHNEKHRETEKDKYKILVVTPNTELNVYIDNLKHALYLAQEALHKITTPFEMPIYIAKSTKLENDNLNIANLNATEELYKEIKQNPKEENFNFYTIKLPKGSPLVYYTNITCFNNLNQTLPIGMDVTTQVLINLKNYELQEKKEEQFRVNYSSDEYTNRVVEIHAINYEVKEK